jgi:hypothetical protein
MAVNTLSLFEDAPITFGRKFLERHAGHIMSDAAIALVELVANCYDAGATEVYIKWPNEYGREFEISDNGVGMTADQFNRRWKELNYSRADECGPEVEFPAGAKVTEQRIAFGQNGIGRHGAFCFNDTYTVETSRDGFLNRIVVKITTGGTEPFHCTFADQKKAKWHGTKISTVIERNLMSVTRVCEVIGLKFLVVPAFSISVNGKPLALHGLEGVATADIEVPSFGEIKIHQIDSNLQHRTTQLHGVTWWVGRKMVGEPGRWDDFDGPGQILDGRSAAAKRYSFVVEADLLKPHVKPDWSGFFASNATVAVKHAAQAHITRCLDDLLAGTRKKQKQSALAENAEALGDLSPLSRKTIGSFIDEIQRKCPTLGPGDLSRTVEVLATMENARTGQDLLRELSTCSSDDIDALCRILQKWTAREAEIVLNELEWRLKLLKQLQGLVGNPTVDELHQIHPLFDRGLWIFGPEYDGVEFTSNRGMTTTVRTLLGGTDKALPNERTDIVALPDGSLSVHSRDSYDDEGDVDGIGKVLVVELKKGGFEISDTEINQAKRYAKELKKAHNIRPDTEIVAFVLGNSCGDDAADDEKIGSITVKPRRYDILIKRAHARMFNLQRQIKSSPFIGTVDSDVEEVVARPRQMVFDQIVNHKNGNGHSDEDSEKALDSNGMPGTGDGSSQTSASGVEDQAIPDAGPDSSTSTAQP